MSSQNSDNGNEKPDLSAEPAVQRDVEVKNMRSISCKDGDLYIYRESEKNVIVAAKNNPEKSWIKEVPAERTSVEKGEEFHAPPDNWELSLVSKRYFGGYAVYKIPAAGKQVLLKHPESKYIDKKYKVERVGRLKISYVDRCKWDALSEHIDKVESDESTSPSLVRVLKELYGQKYRFEKNLARKAEDTVSEQLSDPPIEVEGRIISPWDHSINMRSCMHLTTAKGDPALDRTVLFDQLMSEICRDRNIVPRQPNMKVEIISDSAD
jgi:hypothetical protein